MKKLLMISLILLLIPLVANAEKIFKFGAGIIYQYRVEDHEFTLVSWELKFERSIYKNIWLGFGFRKETSWGYDGYYLSLYPMYRIQLSKRWFSNISLGVEYGVPSGRYDNYQTVYNENGKLLSQKWIYIVQNISLPGDFVKGNTGTIYPFGTISWGVKFWKSLSIEAGFRVQVLRFGIKSCKFEPLTQLVYDIRDEKTWRLVPGFFIQIGIKLPSKKLK